MWFAALGEYNSNPWLVHLAIHLLRGTPEVRALLAPRLPAFWPRGAAPKLAYGTGPPRLLRATLYHYDFAPKNASAPGGGKWWKRKRVGEYLPPLELGNPSLVTFLRQTGWATDAPRLCRRFEELPQLLPNAADDCAPHDYGAAQRARGAGRRVRRRHAGPRGGGAGGRPQVRRRQGRVLPGAAAAGRRRTRRRACLVAQAAAPTRHRPAGRRWCWSCWCEPARRSGGCRERGRRVGRRGGGRRSAVACSGAAAVGRAAAEVRAKVKRE